MQAAEAAGLVRDGGEEQLTDELLGAVVEAVRPARPRGRGEAWECCEAERERIEAWLDAGVPVVKIGDLLARRGVNVPERTLHRFCAEELGYRRQKTTVPVNDGWDRASAGVGDVRRRVQHDQTGHRGRTRDPLYGVRKLLLTACEGLTRRGWQRLAVALHAGDPDGQVTAAWQLKELTRDLYRADTLDAAREVLQLLYARADTGRILEMRRFAGTIRRWQPEVLAWHTTGGASNGPPKR